MVDHGLCMRGVRAPHQRPLSADTVEKVFLGGWSKFLEAAGALIEKQAGSTCQSVN